MGLSEVKKRQDFWNNSAPLASCKIQLARGAELFQKGFFGHNFFERTEFVLQYQKSKKVGKLPIDPPVWNGSKLVKRTTFGEKETIPVLGVRCGG